MKRFSIRWSLTLWYGAVLAVILVGYSGAVYLLMRHHLLALTDAALAEELADISGDVLRCGRPEEFSQELGPRYASHDGYEFQVSTRKGEVLFRSDGLGARGLPIPAQDLQTLPAAHTSLMLDGLGPVRLARRTVSGPANPLVVQVVVSLAPNERALRELLMVLLLTVPPVVAGALGGGYWLARKALAPVDRMAATAKEITSTQLDRRLHAPNSSDELGRLANTFNDMIARLQRSFDEIRRFTADAAHELRTPLASMRTDAEVALRAPRSAENDQRVLENLLEDMDRLTRLVTQLLFLCREDAGLPLASRLVVRLDEVVLDVTAHMQVVAKEKGLLLEVPDLPACSVYGEPDRLRQLFFNVIDNAIKYTPAEGLIVVSSSSLNGCVHVDVTDSGTGIPDADLPRVFDRFYRADPSRSRAVDGTGLGLAICRSISEAHGGHIAVRNNPGNGCTVTVEFPIAAVDIQAGNDALDYGVGVRQ